MMNKRLLHIVLGPRARRPLRVASTLRGFEKRLSAFVEATSDIVYEMSADWQEMHSLVGKMFLPSTERPRADWMDAYIPNDEQPRVWAAIHHAIATRSSFACEHRVLRIDGTIGWTFSRAIPFLNAAGDIVTWFGTASDITARKRAEEALRASEAQYHLQLEQEVRDRTAELKTSKDVLQATIDAPNIGIAVYKAVRAEQGDVVDFVHEFINRASGVMLGEDFTGRLLSDHGENGTTQLQPFIEVIETGQANGYVRELSFRGRDMWFAITNTPLDSDRLVHTWENVTERKSAEAEILCLKDEIATKATEKYLSLFNSIAQAFCTFEVLFDTTQKAIDLRFLEINPVFEKLTGLKDVAGKRMSALLPNVQERWLQVYSEVVVTRVPKHFEDNAVFEGRWLDVYGFAIDAPQEHRVAVLFNDITERKQREQAQAFLLQLGDALRPLSAPMEIQHTALRVLGEHLNVDRTLYAEIEPDDAHFVIASNHVRGNFSTMIGRYALSDFGQTLHAQRIGETLVTPDMSDTGESDEHLAAYLAAGVQAIIGVPLHKDGRWVASLTVHHGSPRQWTPEEAARVSETAERTWAAVERANAETARAASEAKYRTLFDSIDEGFSVLEMIFDDQGRVVDYWHREHNQSYVRMTGTRNAIGKRMSELLPDLEQEWYERLNGVVRTGEPVRVEYPVQQLNQWYTCYLSRIGGEGSPFIAAVYDDITQRKLQEERQAFLLKLSDTLRAEIGVEAVGNRAVRMIAERLGVDRAYLVTLTPGDDTVVVTHEARRADMPPLRGSYRGSDFPSAIKEIFERTIVYNDVGTDTRLTDLDRLSFAGLGAVGFIAAPIRRGSEAVIWAAGALSTQPRVWTATDVALFEDAVERTWAAVERARAEAALRASEERYAALFAGSPVPFMVLAPNPPDFTITAANDAYLAATLTTREGLVGRRLFDVFTDDPTRPGQLGSEALNVSLDRVLTARRLDVMARTRYDIVTPGGGFEPHWWLAINAPVLDASGQITAIIHQVTRVTELHRAEEAARERQEHQAFLLKLSDALRPLADSAEMERIAMRVLGEKLGVDRAFFATIDADGETWSIRHDYANAVPSNTGLYPMSTFQRSRLAQWQAGRMSSVADSDADSALSAADRAAYAAFDTRAAIGVPLVKGGRFAALLSVNQARPRVWTAAELTLTSEVAERTWAAIERARAEEALRAREEKYRTLFETMDEGFTVCGVIRDAVGQVVDLSYLELNRALEQQTGLDRRAVVGRRLSDVFLKDDMERWLPIYAEVINSGEPVAFEEYAALLDRWFVVSVYPRPGDELAIFYRDITERKRAEEQQAFLLKLSDALRPLSDPVAVQETTMQVLGVHLGVSRAFYSEVFDDENTIVIDPGYANGVPLLAGQMTFSEFDADMMNDYRTGQTIVLDDTQGDAHLTVHAKAVFDAIQVRAAVGVPLVKNGKVRAILSIHQSVPRTWTAAEIVLLQETAERIWAAVERAKAEAALRASDVRFRTLTDAVPQLIWANTANGVANYFNARWFSYSGLSLDESFGLGWQAMVHPDDAPASVERWQRALATGAVFDTEYRLQRADGIYRWHLGRNVPLHDARGQVIGWFGSATDIDDLKQAEAAVQQANATLEARVVARTHALSAANATLQDEMSQRVQAEADRAALVAQLITAQEDERHRIARELHDSLGQFLAALKLRITLAQTQVGMPAAVVTDLAQLHTIAQQIDQELDRLTMALRPPSLDSLGLGAALESATQEWSTISGVPVDLVVPPPGARPIPLTVETTVYRIVQEALTNILKYAQATLVSIIVEPRGAVLQVIVEDNGVGFDHDQAQTGTRGRHVGLIGMRERAALVGGTLTIESAPGSGTTVFLYIPLPEAGS